MSVADAAGFVHEPTSIDTWRTVLNAVIDNVQGCVLERNGAGGMHFANSTSASNDLIRSSRKLSSTILTLITVDDANAKVVYIYAVGSPFETILNKYMSGYNVGVNPDNPVAFLTAVSPTNASSTLSKAGSSSFERGNRRSDVKARY